MEEYVPYVSPSIEDVEICIEKGYVQSNLEFIAGEDSEKDW